MSTYSVGQKVWMQSGPRRREGTVIETSDYRVAVEFDNLEGEEPTRYAIHFTRPGKQGTIFEKVRQCGVFIYTGQGWDEYDRRPMCTEFGPWEIVDEATAKS